MVRKVVYGGTEVVAAAVAIVERFGFAGLSARRVADELGSSTAPVYSNFANMEELGLAVKAAVSEQMLAFTATRYTDDPFLDLGLGVLEFARAKPGLYSAVFMLHDDSCEAGDRVMARLAEQMADLPGVSELPAGERALLLHHVAIYTHGLAAQICAGLTSDIAFADLVTFLADAGGALLRHAQISPARTPAQLALIRTLMPANPKDT